MSMSTWKDFMKKNSKDDTTNESDLQRVSNDPKYPGDFKKHSDKRLVNIDNGTMAGTHWTCFYKKVNKSYCFDSFGGNPDKFLLRQLPKPMIYHN